MNEIYWITRFDYIYGVARVLLILSIITIMVLLMRCIAETDSIDEFVENIKKYICDEMTNHIRSMGYNTKLTCKTKEIK